MAALDERPQSNTARQKGDVIGVEVHERQIGKYRIVMRVTRIYDPEAVEQAWDFYACCIARRLPEIMAQMRREGRIQ